MINSAIYIYSTHIYQVLLGKKKWGRYYHFASSQLSAISFLFFFSFYFLRLHPWHMEVPRLGVKPELDLPAYTTAPATWDPSHVCNLYLQAHCNVRSLTHWARPGIEPASSWILGRFVSAVPQQPLLNLELFHFTSFWSLNIPHPKLKNKTKQKTHHY